MKTLRNLTTIAVVALLASCGGGRGDGVENKYTAAEQEEAAQILDHPPAVGVAQSTADLKRLREARLEKWKEGDATSAPEIPAEAMGVDPKAGRAKILAAGDPVTRPLGLLEQVAPTPTTIPTSAATQGMWSGVYNWPLIPIHMGMLPDGRLMTYGTNQGGRQTGKTEYAIFDPVAGLTAGHTIFPKETLADIFCSALLWMPATNQMVTFGGDVFDGQWALNQGNNSSTIFTPQTNTLVAGKNMALPRWYATATTMPDGSTYIQGGLGGEAYPEMRSTTGDFRSLTAAPTPNLDYWYPRNWYHSSGRIFGYDSYGNYYFVTTTGTGSIQIVNQWDVNYFGEAGSAAMYLPGRILQLSAFTNRAAVIDIRTNTPTLTATQSMNTRRQNVNATVLPNGKVLATGGSIIYNDISAGSPNNTAATWDPATGQWTLGSNGYLPRLYHSIAMLMPDGTVLVGGGGAWGPLSNNNVEFYYPSYLFTAGGGWATKPVITSAPETMEVGGTFKISVNDAGAPVTRVTMIKAGATTHSLNMDQNFNPLTFTRAGNELTVQLPTSPVDATPGYYMVFALTANGTPSIARMVRLNIPALAIPAPTAVTATYAVATGVTVKWTQSTGVGVTHNIISRGPSATGPFTQIARIPVNTQYVDPIQTVGTYYYVVTAVNTNSAVSVNSNVATATIGGGQPPVEQAPGPVTGLTLGVTGTGVNLTWTNPTGQPITNVLVQRGTAAAGPFTTIATLGNVAAYSDPLTTAGTYYYRVAARNSTGAGAYSNVATVTVTGTPPATVAAPTGLSGYTCGAGCWTTDTGVRFNWTSSTTAGVTSQQVERADSPTGVWAVVANLGTTIGTYVDKLVEAGKTYYYRVRAFIGGSASPYATLSYGVTSNITLTTPPPAMTKAAVSATPAAPTVGQAISLSGASSTPASGTTIVGYEWTITNAGGTGAAFTGTINTMTTTLTTTAAGTVTVSLKVTDNQGGTNTLAYPIVVTAGGSAGAFSIESQGETRYLVMNWWRGNPATEGDFRQPGICTGPTPAGNCFLGARKTFRPMAFNIATTPTAVAGLVMMDVPQFENGIKSYDHYRLPVEFVKTGCTFKVRHVRTHGPLEFGLNPPGLEILDHKFTMPQAMCDAYPTGAMTQAWLNTLNTALTTYLGAKVAYNPIAYPYNDPRTHTDPSN